MSLDIRLELFAHLLAIRQVPSAEKVLEGDLKTEPLETYLAELVTELVTMLDIQGKGLKDSPTRPSRDSKMAVGPEIRMEGFASFQSLRDVGV